MTIADGSRLRQAQTLGVLALAAAALVAALCTRAVGAAETPHAPRAGSAPAVAGRVAAQPAQPFPGWVPAGTRQVVSVVAASLRSHTASMRRWQLDASGSWRAVGPAVRVSLGSGGLTTRPSDTRPQTPIGTWAMDLVLSRDPHITRMPEHVLRPGDGWSSCLTCPDYDRLAATDEMWSGRNTWSRVAIHIATNPDRIRGRSSGVFLHVGNGRPTAACIGAPLPAALSVASWLDPTQAPRMVIALR